MVWAVFLHGAEGWTIKKSDKNRIEALEIWCWRKMLGVSWREHRTNKSILEELDVERELMAKVVKLKLQYREQWRKKTREWSAAVANPRRRKADKREIYSYNERLAGNCIRGFHWYQF